MIVELTPHQIRTLKAIMRDLLDVSEDKSVLRDARRILIRLDDAQMSPKPTRTIIQQYFAKRLGKPKR